MPTKKNAVKTTRSSSKSTKNRTDSATALLMKDHKEVKGLFAQFKKLAQGQSKGQSKAKSKGSADDQKAQLVAEICKKLTIHTQLEEEIFYPAVRQALSDESVMNEATVEHAGAKLLIAQLQDMSPDEELYDAKVIVLSEYIAHHVKEEEGEMFPQARKAKALSESLGERLEQRKEELLAAEEERAPATGGDHQRKPGLAAVSRPATMHATH